MKKKILLFVAILSVLACVFAISASATATPNNAGETFTTADGEILALYDVNDKPLVWFYDSVNSEYVSFILGETVDFMKTDGVNVLPSFTDFTQNTPVKFADESYSFTMSNVVLINLRESNINQFSGSWTNVPVQAIYNSTKLKHIQKSIFNNNTTLKVFDIPENTETAVHFGGSAFARASAIEYIYIPVNSYFESTSTFEYSGIKKVKFHDQWTGALKGYDFFSCYYLEEVILPSTITDIPQYTFAFKNTVANNTVNFSITLPNNIQTMGYRAFQNNTSLVSINFGTGFKEFTNDAAFENCKRLAGAIVFPEGFKTIKNHTFQSCTSIQSVSLPSTLETLGSKAFIYCTSLETVTGLENTKIKSIGNDAFRGDTKWKPDVIVVPNSVTSIGDFAFADVGMKSIVLGASVTSLGSETFTGCASLVDVYVPGTITSIQSNSFNNRGSKFYVTSTDTDYLNNILKSPTGAGTIVSYADYTLNPGKYTGKLLISGYSECKAFYNDVHVEGDTVNGNPCYLVDCSRCDAEKMYIGGDINSGTHTLAVEYEYANGYMQAGQIVSICSNPGCTHSTKETAFTEKLEPIFKGLKYSISNTGTGICVVYDIDQDAVAKYEESGKTLKYGVAAAFSTNTNNGEIVKTDATVADGLNGVIVANITDTSLKSVTFRIHGDKKLWEDNNTKSLYMVGFATNGDAVEYLGESSGSADRTNLASVNAILISEYFPTQA